MAASALLRHNKPRLPVQAWTTLVAQVLLTGDRKLAAQVARLARQACPRLSKLRSAPRLVFPCPVPTFILTQIHQALKTTLRSLPAVRRSVLFDVVLEATSVCWEKTAFAESILSPSQLLLDEIGVCQCSSFLEAASRKNGHVITRQWCDLSPCRELWEAIELGTLDRSNTV